MSDEFGVAEDIKGSYDLSRFTRSSIQILLRLGGVNSGVKY